MGHSMAVYTAVDGAWAVGFRRGIKLLDNNNRGQKWQRMRSNFRILYSEWMIGESCFDSWQVKKILLNSKVSKPVMGPTKSPTKCVTKTPLQKQSDRDVKLTIYLDLQPWLRMRGFILPTLPYTLILCTGTSLPYHSPECWQLDVRRWYWRRVCVSPHVMRRWYRTVYFG